MIARVWHGITSASKGDAYVDYLMESGIKAYRSMEGSRRVRASMRPGSKSDFVLISLWESYDAIRRFAGPDFERSVYYPRDKDFLVEFEPNVSHYDVLLTPEYDS